MGQTERLYKIQALLQRERAVPLSTFLAELEVSRATFNRNIETLRDRYQFAVRATIRSGTLPPPVNDDRCRHCSLIDICQPEAMAAGGKLHQLRDKLFDPDAPP